MKCIAKGYKQIASSGSEYTIIAGKLSFEEDTVLH